MLKDLVKKYWLELEMITAAKKDHHVSGNEDLIGWELLEIVNRDPFSSLKKPSTKKFKGNWFGLAGDPTMIVLFCHGLGDVFKPSPNVEEVCSRWESVPTENDYLTATNNCIIQCSKRLRWQGSMR